MAKKKSSKEDDVFDLEQDSSAPETVAAVQSIPDYCSPQWSDYVLSQFEPEELDEEGMPKVAGLRRIAQKLLGQIAVSIPASTAYIGDRAIVTWRLEIEVFGRLAVFGGAADASPSNMHDQKYATFPIAMAEVRAEARALKRALLLNVVSSEEVMKKSEQMEDVKVESDKISPSQVKFLSVKYGSIGVDMLKLVATYNPEYKSVDEVSREDAAKMIMVFNDYQSGKIEIPSEIKKENE